MPWTPWRRTSSAARKASSIVVRRSTMVRSFSFGMTMSVSTTSRRRWMPSSAWRMRWVPSNSKGFVTTPTVSAPISFFAISAMTGAAPVPVPPPSPAVTKTMSAPLSASLISSRDSAAAPNPVSGLAPAPEALRQLVADVELDVGVAHLQRLGVGVRGDELDAAQAGVDHAVDRVGPAAADADDLDDGEVAAAALHEVLPSESRGDVEAFGRTTPCQGQRHGKHGIGAVSTTSVAEQGIVQEGEPSIRGVSVAASRLPSA